MSDDRRHLTGSDFEVLLNSSGGGGDAELAAFRAHLAQCAQCSRQMEWYRIQVERLRGLRTSPGARTSENCPAAEQLMLLAAGRLEEHQSDAVMDHAASCDACGALLRIAVEDLHSVEVPVEAATAMGEPFRLRIASELRKQSLREKAPIPIKARRGLYAAGAIAAGIALLALAGKGIELFGRKPETLAARAYEANRTWPIRFPGASYTPLRSVDRSASAGGTPLAEADAAVSKGLDAYPKDPRWLQLRSQVDFLHRRYNAAIEDLLPLAEGPSVSAGVWIGLGSAHLARGIAEGEAADSEKAVEYFSRALRAEPRNPIALFNRAVALEALYLWDRAEQDWKSYLEVDPGSGWADEARGRLQQAIQKKNPGSAN